VSLAVISSGTNENISIEPKGTGGAIVTSSGATAFAVGPGGATNPGLLVVGNISSAATGLSITGRAAGAGVSLAVISSGSNEDLSVEPKGTGSIYFGNGITSATPATSLLTATGGAGTNIVAASFSIAPGRGTGNAIQALARLSYPTTQSSGTTLHGLSTGSYAVVANSFIQVSDVTVTQNTDTSIFTTGVDSTNTTIEAGSARVGRTWHFIATGDFAIVAANTLTIKAKIGSSTIATIVITGAAGDGGRFQLEVIFSIIVVGTSGTINVELIRFDYTNTAASISTVRTGMANGQVTAVNFQNAQTLDVTGAYSAVAGGNAWSVFHVISNIYR
jgi:hypothetical protein